MGRAEVRASLGSQNGSGDPKLPVEGQELAKPVMHGEAAVAFALGHIKGFSDDFFSLSRWLFVRRTLRG